jgi:hypothetical protein
MAAYLTSICRSVSDRAPLEDYWAHVGPSFEGFDAKPVKQRRLGATEFELILVDGGSKPAAERMPDTR